MTGPLRPLRHLHRCLAAGLACACLVAGEPSIEHAATPMPVQDAVRQALLLHPAQRAATAGIAAADGERRRVRSVLLPEAGLTGYAMRSSDDGGRSGLRDGWDGRAVAKVPLIDAANWKRTAAAGERVVLARGEAAADADQVAADAALAALGAAGAEAARAARAEDVELALAIAEFAEELAKGGETARIEAERAQAELEAARAKLIQGEGDLAAARALLALTVAGDPARPPGPAPLARIVSSAPKELGPAMQLAARSRGDLAAAESRIREHGLELTAIRREPLPVVWAFADYGYGSDWDGGAGMSWHVGLRGQITLFDGLSREARADTRIGLSAQAVADRDALVAGIAGAIGQAQARLGAAQAAAERWTSAIIRAEAEVALSRERLRGGIGDGIAVAEARGRLARARDGLIGARVDAGTAAIRLAAACGVAASLAQE
jgi:outer membrane protein TolC